MTLTATTPLVALVTDRRRLAARQGQPARDSVSLLLSQVAAAAEAGVGLVIVREHDLEARALATLVRRLRTLLAHTPTRLVVNDRLDVALAAGAHGAHLREASVTAADARGISPEGFLIGRSVHDASGALAAGPVDYLIAGTVFPSSSKPDAHPWLGLEGFARIVAAAGVPVIGIGGISAPAHVRAVRRAGGAGVAVVGALQPGLSDRPLATEVQNCAYRLRSGFDLSGGVS